MKIRIRAYNTKSNDMFSPDEMSEDQMTLLPTGNFINVHVHKELSVIYPIETMIPMLSSLLYDRKGTEIFEGDIVKRYYLDLKDYFDISIVVFRKGKFMYKHPTKDAWADIYPDSCEVVGNILQHKYLLEK